MSGDNEMEWRKPIAGSSDTRHLFVNIGGSTAGATVVVCILCGGYCPVLSHLALFTFDITGVNYGYCNFRKLRITVNLRFSKN